MKSQDSNSKAVKHFYEFGAFRLDLEERLLSSHDGETILLAPKIFETLVLLIENKGRVVKKEEHDEEAVAGSLCGGVEPLAEHFHA